MSDEEVRGASNARIAEVQRSEVLSDFNKVAIQSKALAALERAEQWWNNKDQVPDSVRTYVQSVATRVINKMQQEQNLRIDPHGCNPAGDRINGSVIHLFILLLTNFNAYLVESPIQGRGMFGSFKQPPEWCVDTSPQGLMSFFGEDWGAPPERVSRDRRYRSETPRPNHPLYERSMVDRWA